MKKTKYVVDETPTRTQISQILKVLKEPRGNWLESELEGLKKGSIADLSKIKVTSKKTLSGTKRRLLIKELVKCGVLPDENDPTVKVFELEEKKLVISKEHETLAKQFLNPKYCTVCEKICHSTLCGDRTPLVTDINLLSAAGSVGMPS